jgi:hypothetical protein
VGVPLGDIVMAVSSDEAKLLLLGLEDVEGADYNPLAVGLMEFLRAELKARGVETF